MSPKPKILLVDDEERFRTTLKKMLTAQGLTVALAAGEDTLALFEQVRSRVGYVHVNDVGKAGVFEFAPIGTGLAPIREVLRRLREQGYAGWVGIEEASRTGKQGFRQAVQYTRRALQAS